MYEERDPSFYMGVGKTTSEKYICISVRSTVSSEMRCTPAAQPGNGAAANGVAQAAGSFGAAKAGAAGAEMQRGCEMGQRL